MITTMNRQIPQLANPALSLDLNGLWQVRKWPFSVDERKLAAPSTNDRAWESIPQPGKVFYSDPEAGGKEIPNWNRVTLSHIDPEDGAVLRRKVTVPSAWRSKRIILRFDAVFPAGRFYINGQFLGEHLSGLTPVEFDVTDYVTAGKEALVAVRLIRRHKFVQMDMVRHSMEFGGLAQPATLFAVERCHAAEHHLVSTLDARLTTGKVAGTVTVANAGKKAVPARVTVTVSDASGKRVATAAAKATVAAGGEKALPVKLVVKRPQLWNDEAPNLYRVEITLAVPGQAAQNFTYRTGFRRLDLSPEGPRLNGNPVKFRGVNHLTFHPEFGMYTPESWLRSNLKMMKRANVNCIRTHYLGPRCLSDLCDEMGFYLLQELPIDWGTDYIHDPEWVPPALLRIEGGVRRDRHHPSLMVWSVGNENMAKTQATADAGWSHLRQYDALVKQLDPSRPTMFPPPGPANKIKGIFEVRVGDIADTHYSFTLVKDFLATGQLSNPRSWEAEMETCTREEALARGWSGVWFSSEWGIHNMIPDLLNAPYGSIIDDVQEPLFSERNSLQVFQDRLDREWGLMRSERTCLGGAFFPWICAAAGSGPEGNPWGWMRFGEDADWGVMCADLTPKPFFWAMRVAYSPVQFPKRFAWQKGQRDINFEIENQFNSIDLSECVLRVQSARASIWMTCIRPFIDVPVSCPPGGRVTLRIPLPDDQWRAHLDGGNSAMVRCTLLDPKGFKVIVAETLVLSGDAVQAGDQHMPIGPDAVLD